MAQNFSLSVIFSAIDKITNPLKKMARGFKQVQKPIEETDTKLQKLNKQFVSTGRGITGIGKSLSLKVTAPLTAFGAVAIKSSMDFNKGMANVATLIPGNIKRVKELKESVRDLAKDVGKRTSDIAGGLYQTISAFGDDAETIKRVKINAMAATAGLATTTEAINLTSAVTKGYGDISEKAMKKAADLAFTTVKLGVTTFPQLAASIGKVVPLASKLGISQEELFAGFATLTGVTGDASEVSTQMAAVLTSILKPTTLMTKAVNHLGYSSAVAMAKEEGLTGTIQKLFKLVKGDEEIFTELLGGRKEGLIYSFALAGEQADNFKKRYDAMFDSSGAMVQAFKEQTEGINKLGHSFQQFLTIFEIFRQNVGEKLTPIFMKVLSPIQKMFKYFNNLTDTTKKVIIGLGIFVGILGPMALGIGTVVTGIGLMSGALGISAIALSGILGTVTLIGITIGAWGATIYQLVKNWKVLFRELWEFIKEGFSNLIFNFQQDFIEGLQEILPKKLQKWIGIDAASLRGEGTPGASGEWSTGFSGTSVMQRGAADVNITLTASPGTEAKVDKVKKITGDVNVNLATKGYVGATTTW